MREQKTAIVNRIHVVGQKWVGYVRADILPAEARIGGLFRGDCLVDANIRTVGASRGGLKVFVVIPRLANHIRQRDVLQQGRRGRADVGNRSSQRRVQPAEVAIPLGLCGYLKLLRNRGRTAVGLVVGQEKSL